MDQKQPNTHCRDCHQPLTEQTYPGERSVAGTKEPTTVRVCTNPACSQSKASGGLGGGGDQTWA